MERIYTIGAYGFDAAGFFQTLTAAEVDLFLDLRRRRGVRGSQYAFANAARLQAGLSERGIAYRHLLDLAPQPETRALQDGADLSARVAKRKRTDLDEQFVADYTRRTLEPFDWPALISELVPVRRPVLFCVEGKPEACHRHLVADRLEALTHLPVVDLVA